MKKIFIFILILVSGFTAFYFYHQQPPVTSPSSSSSPDAPTSPLLEKMETITVNSKTYYFSYVLIDDLNKLKFYPNFKDQLSSLELIDKYHCRSLVNGGFYSEDIKPLGWLVSDSRQLSSPIDSQLFNGYLSVFNNHVSIARELPSKADLGLQTGPLLVYDQQPLLLKINNDEPRRRIVSALTPFNQLLFIAIIQNDSLFSGPLLADLPTIVKTISMQINHPVTEAINLDGGSASAFYSPSVHLKEFSPIGSFFCLP